VENSYSGIIMEINLIFE